MARLVFQMPESKVGRVIEFVYITVLALRGNRVIHSGVTRPLFAQSLQVNKLTVYIVSRCLQQAGEHKARLAAWPSRSVVIILFVFRVFCLCKWLLTGGPLLSS